MANILVIEDDRSLLFMLKTLLESDRHLVDCCETGFEAANLLRTGDYDVAVLDWNLPDISGVDICEEYRSSGGVCPIIMLTAGGSASDKVRALDVGADYYLAKPFDPQEFLAGIRALLRGRQV